MYHLISFMVSITIQKFTNFSVVELLKFSFSKGFWFCCPARTPYKDTFSHITLIAYFLYLNL